ncbi:MAG TPA: dephospho-CoA kinase, partial [Gammaproteobacteria bacterium]|nr:dephospho-CoA kinase [Gammaproteobacteria bacterium]
ALTKIHHHFGPRVFDPAQQQLDRAALRALVLKNPASRKKLESILHPLIEATVTLRLHCVHAPICLLVVPLLLEVGWHTKVDRILVIDAPDTLRRRWIKARSHLSDSEIDALFASQTNRNTRLSHADEVINNHQGRSYLYRQVDELHRRYLRAVICT